ncbi:MAG: hypothetical protein LBG30_01590 [Odoribacteraceae bacterium]|jgi:enamine deaminase RidA (YjgF/YER057c/UK114 family)|nr:hypothetical protein [Odoribacteraceae bacterium]
MDYQTIRAGALPVNTRFSVFSTWTGAKEYHAVFIPPAGMPDVAHQLDLATRAFPTASGHSRAVPVWRRFYMSDVVNLRPRLGDDWPAAESFIGQALPGGERAAALCYYVDDARVERRGNTTIMQRRALQHHYYTGQFSTAAATTSAQTRALFRALLQQTTRQGARFADDVLRAWIYINDIDNRYSDMVGARRDFFRQVGLTPETHYIASTGIEGKSHVPRALLHADLFAIKGIPAAQVTYLNAPDYLGRPDRYGVTFERATLVAHGDRALLLVSGTASIDPLGNILFPLDVQAQTLRTIQNIEALLHEGGATATDLTHALVYLRDPSDYPLVSSLVASAWPSVPALYTVAPVCRPGWLVEIECSALVARSSPFPPF